MTDYAYADGPLIDAPNTYFYSRFDGADFLRSWSQQRQALLEQLGVSATNAPDGKIAADHQLQWPVETSLLLDHVFACAIQEDGMPHGAQIWLERLIKKFEVTKRIHHAYREGFLAVDKSARNSLTLYLRLGEVFEAAYASQQSLPALNALLKVIDTLCSQIAMLPPELMPRLARLIENERVHIEAFADAREVTW